MTKLGIVALIIVSVSFACKAKEKSSEKELPKDPLAVVDVTPDPPPEIDAAEPPVLGETPLVLLDSTTAVTAQWAVTDTNIRVRAAFAEGTEGATNRDATVYATVGEAEETKVFSCKKLEIASGPRVEAMLRGEHMHVLCINPPAGESKGATDAIRLQFSPSKTALVESGSYSGEGVVDPDSIDLDESDGEF